MRIYSVSLWEGSDGHRGFAWFSSRRAAEQRSRQWTEENDGFEATGEITAHDVELTRGGLLRFLSLHASHPDNG
jgi:hypothetical protein